MYHKSPIDITESYQELRGSFRVSHAGFRAGLELFVY